MAMSRKTLWQAVLIIMCLCACTHALEPMVLAGKGKAQAKIVVASQAPEAEQHAAAELAHFLNQITGASYEVTFQAPPDQAGLFVGKQAARFASDEISTRGLGKDGFLIRSLERGLVLTGDTGRGTLYAVFSFLEDHLGCRWWTSKVSTIPYKPSLSIKPIDRRDVPKLEYREVYWTDAIRSGDWAVRNKCNGNGHHLETKHGDRERYQGFVHTFYALIPPDKYFKEHPEWYSEIQGQRKHQRAQLCLSNVEMRSELIKNLKQTLRANPAATIASVSQNDWHGYCRCEACAAIDQAEGSPAGSLLRFVNAVADDIKAEFPQVAISTLAYQYTRKPPQEVKPRDNVIIRLCSIECSFAEPLSHERNAKFRDDIIGWSKVCDRLYIWDYTTNFRHYFRPHPNLRSLGPNVKFFADHGVKGIFEQGAYTSLGAEMAELRAWVLAKLLWNTERDAQALINEFLAGYYGPAASHLSNYIDIMHHAIAKTGDYLGCLPSYTSPVPKFLLFEPLAQSWIELKAAEAAVKDNPELRKRVKLAQLPVLYCFLRQWKAMHKRAQQIDIPWPLDSSIDIVHKQFMDTAQANDVTRLNEWNEGFGLLEEALKKAGQ
jgi:hypothetical protein